MEKLGNTCYSEKQKLFLPHPSSGSEIAAGKSGPSPSMEETSKTWLILHPRQRHEVSCVAALPRGIPKKADPFSGLISDLSELGTDSEILEAEC